MVKKIIVNLLVVILIAIGFHYLRMYNILQNAFEASEVFKNVTNITVKRDVYRLGEDTIYASLEYRIKDDDVLAIIKDSNGKVDSIFKVDLNNYIVQEYKIGPEGVPLKESEEEISTPQEYLDNTLCNLIEGRSFKEFFIDSLFRLVRMDNDNYIIKVRSYGGEEYDAYISRKDFTISRLVNLEEEGSTVIFSYELGNVTDEMLDIHNI
jgi:hypothetical protein